MDDSTRGHLTREVLERHTIWHEYWTDITADSFTQMGDVTQPDGTTTHFMTIHGKRVQELRTIGTE